MKKAPLHIIKIGGAVLENAEKRAAFLASFAQLEGNKLLVHGGGRQATDLGEKMGLETRMIEGRRITDDQYIDVVTMVYGGLINKQLVAHLQALGCNALGLTGADGSVITSLKRSIRNGIDYGWVGDPQTVNVELITDLLTFNLTPVFAPLTHDGAGHLLNTNADTIASTLAIALSARFDVQLVYAFELDGVLTDIQQPDSLIHKINPASYEKLKAQGKVTDGMIPKLDNAFTAIAQGVSSVKIVKYTHIGQLHSVDFQHYTHISE